MANVLSGCQFSVTSVYMLLIVNNSEDVVIVTCLTAFFVLTTFLYREPVVACLQGTAILSMRLPIIQKIWNAEASTQRKRSVAIESSNWMTTDKLSK